MNPPSEVDGWRVVQDPDPGWRHLYWRCRAFHLEWRNWYAAEGQWVSPWHPRDAGWRPEELEARKSFFAELFLNP